MILPIKKFAAKSSQGPYLGINEDGLDVDIENGLILLLDGMGGANIGDAFVLQSIENIKNYYLHLIDDPESTMPFYYNPQYNVSTNALINALKRTHEESIRKNKEKSSFQRAAACILALCFEENTCSVISMGNCSAYLSRLNFLCPIFSEGNFRYFDMDLSQKNLRSVPQKALGLFDEFYFEIRELKIYEKDTLILLTDGVNSMMNGEELRTIIHQPQENYQKIIDLLFSYANNKGNRDNQSAIILQF